MYEPFSAKLGVPWLFTAVLDSPPSMAQHATEKQLTYLLPMNPSAMRHETTRSVNGAIIGGHTAEFNLEVFCLVTEYGMLYEKVIEGDFV